VAIFGCEVYVSVHLFKLGWVLSKQKKVCFYNCFVSATRALLFGLLVKDKKNAFFEVKIQGVVCLNKIY